MSNWFEKLQSIGKALMLPIAVLPAAALLLRLGAPDVLNIPFVTKAGGAIFDNLALIFAIGIGVGLAKDNNGAAGLAGAIGYLVLTSGLKAINPDLNMSVLAGILSGIEAGLLYNKYHAIKLPEFLGFFGGRRFVPIATALVSLVLALIFGVIWGPCQAVIHAVGEWIIGAGVVGTFVYGVLNRLLIPVGLHHILNSFIWFVFGEYTTPDGVVATGDLNRFFAGDPHAGMFMAGFYIMMMFGMPAVALAMYHAAKKENRPKIAGALASVAFTAFLTGITEPIEFMFMFIAPVLYGIHAVLTGLALSVAYAFGILHGFGFSAGFIDYVLNWGLATKPAMIIPLGLVFGVLYYVIFSWAIRHYDLPTIGRYDDEGLGDDADAPADADDYTKAMVENLGGLDNLTDVGYCITRLRLTVKDPAKVDEEAIKLMGVRGVFVKGKAVQVVIGTRAELVANDINALRKK
ncbi:MAG: N-acetylglucosamine-specific PTS transporter subunit IIBC [Selenomonas sp.]|uniref:N-acetylglucosamine-specific PTS transporter subunit IIBC n=1 Tax=Selenomonas sp. TaxID=2053611 RepID=UPI0025DFA0C6|nr:N-acetylglucosamine-specific PTS transporter subunit IIBC [Selenomonas sp.]MCI6086987.1 N-acetylglucosamine-specific PTS transporter subunit IIBC [Selenomonas sp.]